ncbi:nitrilase, partial [Candidatus Micrarchaeota archaeon CG_4_10_14_0_2_um_filter_49_7]
PVTGEDRIFTPGDRAATFKLDGFTFGLAICYDVRFPKIFEKYAGVDAMVIGACFFHERIAQWEVLVRARALELQAYAIGCNALLPEIDCHGYSLIVKPDGSIMGRASEQEQLLTAVLEKKAITETRERITTLKDAKKIKLK